MNDGHNKQSLERIYASQEVCLALNIKPSTLRTWCLKLEAQGYIFKREKVDEEGNPKGNRMFFERDIVALRVMQNLLDKGHPMEYAVQKVASEYKPSNQPMTHTVIASSTENELPVPAQTLPSSERQAMSSEEFMAMFREMLEQERQRDRDLLRQEIQRARQEIAAEIRQEFEQQRAREEERDKVLMETLRQLQEKKKEKGFFGKLLGR